MLNEVIGVCPRCLENTKLVTHLFQGQEVVSLCQTCENDIKKDEELSSEFMPI